MSEAVRAQWAQWRVRNLAWRPTQGHLEPPAVMFRGITVASLTQGRSNKSRRGTYYLFFEFYAETALEPEPGKMLAYAYRARLRTSDLSQLAQGARPRVIQGSIAFDRPRETLWPTLASLRQL